MVAPLRLLWAAAARPPLFRRRWSKTAVSLGVGWAAAAGVTCGATVALCRPLDTPGYLIPYYLRDVRSRFSHYASHRKRDGGPKFMTVEDFVRAVLATPDATEPINEYAVEGIRRIFAELDANGDAYISQNEFSFLMLLLTAPTEDLRFLFAFLDERRVGSLNLQQFAGVVRGLGCDHAEAETLLRHNRKGIVQKLFGADFQSHCSYDQLAQLLDSIKGDIWKAEFRQFDTDRNDRISAEQFGQLIANQMLGSHVPFHIVDNMRKLRGRGETVTLDMWISFHRVMQSADDITEAVELYTAAGLPLRRQDFNRAVKAAGLPAFSEVELDLIMALFDRNNDGVLQYEELMSVMKQKMSYHVRSAAKAKKSLPTRLSECVGEAVRGP